MQSTYTLEARNLQKRFKDLVAVDHVDLHVKMGECFALLGPNGAGKTTTCEMLEGLLPTDGGTITIFGQNYAEHKAEILEKIGVQLQETNLYKKYTVWETFQLFASFYKQPEDLTKLLNMLQLEPVKNKRLEHLSGGQKQRVYLACSLINRPQLLFLDEPSSGLDPQSRHHLWEALEECKTHDRSIFLTTHFMEEAEKLADRVAIMDHGKIIAEGSPKELIARYVSQGTLEDVFLHLTGRSIRDA